MNLVDISARPEAVADHRIDEPRAPRPRSDTRWRRGAVAVVFVGLVSAFVIHLLSLGSWLVDDAAISMAYANNLVHGHGLVAQVGQSPVEGFSNPLWVGVLAVVARAGLLGPDSILGPQSYVLVMKTLAVCLHACVLAGMAVIVRRVLTVARRTPAPFRLWLACWAGAGLLLALNPSYVIWMGSGLENPLLAASVVGLAAVAVTAVPHPTRHAMVQMGLLAGVAALTRPDGLVYAGVMVVVALLVPDASFKRRAAVAAKGLVPFTAVYGAYLVFRVGYFGLWVPNTAVAKHQTMPNAGEVGRLEHIPRAFGSAAFLFVVIGVVAAIVTLRRQNNSAALRVIAVGLVTITLAVVPYVVLPLDWMGELRFLTPAWPLLSVAAALATVQIAALMKTPEVRVATAAVVAVAILLSVPGWLRRSRSFRAEPTLGLCFVAERYGTHLEAAARALNLDPRSASAASPDIGGMLLVDGVRVVDFAGLTDRTIARLLWRGGLADHVLGTVKPTFIVVHDDWMTETGLLEDPRLRDDYVDVYRGEEWVRRDALAGVADPGAAIAQIAADAASAGTTTSPRASCGELFASAR